MLITIYDLQLIVNVHYCYRLVYNYLFAECLCETFASSFFFDQFVHRIISIESCCAAFISFGHNRTGNIVIIFDNRGDCDHKPQV